MYCTFTHAGVPAAWVGSDDIRSVPKYKWLPLNSLDNGAVLFHAASLVVDGRDLQRRQEGAFCVAAAVSMMEGSSELTLHLPLLSKKSMQHAFSPGGISGRRGVPDTHPWMSTRVLT